MNLYKEYFRIFHIGIFLSTFSINNCNATTTTKRIKRKIWSEFSYYGCFHKAETKLKERKNCS